MSEPWAIPSTPPLLATDKAAHDWAKDTDHKRVVDVMDSISGGKITKPARDALRDVLDKADAPPTGRAKSDAGLGRAIR